jgi:hypothetical protein
MQSQFPTWMSQPGSCFFTFKVTGASVGSSAGTAGLDGRGKYLGTISQTANVFTVVWNSAFADVPYIFPAPAAGQANTNVEILTNTAQGFTFEAFDSDDHTTAVVNPNVQFLVVGYNTTSYVS